MIPSYIYIFSKQQLSLPNAFIYNNLQNNYYSNSPLGATMYTHIYLIPTNNTNNKAFC